MGFQYAREFIHDQKLHTLLDEIESFVGYPLPAASMPEYYRPQACANIGQHGHDERFELWYMESELPDQTTLCHELSHVVCWLSGAVRNYVIFPWPERLTLPIAWEALRLIWAYMQHVPVHAFVTAMGYDETNDGDLLVQNSLRNFVTLPEWWAQAELEDQKKEGIATPDSLNLGRDIQLSRIARLLRLAATPQGVETRADLHRLASSCCPRALARASAILEDRGERLLLDPEDYRAHLQAIFRIAGLPSGTLIFSSVGKTDPNFYYRSLVRATGGTDILQK